MCQCDCHVNRQMGFSEVFCTSLKLDNVVLLRGLMTLYGTHAGKMSVNAHGRYFELTLQATTKKSIFLSKQLHISASRLLYKSYCMLIKTFTHISGQLSKKTHASYSVLW